MGTLGLIYHIHHWTWNWQSWTNLVGTVPSRVCTVVLLPWSIPSHSLCLQSAARHFKIASGMRIHAVVRKIWIHIFFYPNILEIDWKVKRCKSLPIYGKQCIFPLKWFPSPKQCLTKAEQWQISCCFLWGCYTLKFSLTDGKHKKIYILSPPHLSLEAAFSSNWTEVIKCGSQIDSAYQQKAPI